MNNSLSDSNIFGSNSFSSNTEEINSCYVNLNVHRSQLELVRTWIGSLDRLDSVNHLAEEDRDVVSHAIQDFYQLICDKLDDKRENPSDSSDISKSITQSVLTDEEEKLLKECLED